MSANYYLSFDSRNLGLAGPRPHSSFSRDWVHRAPIRSLAHLMTFKKPKNHRSLSRSRRVWRPPPEAMALGEGWLSLWSPNATAPSSAYDSDSCSHGDLSLQDSPVGESAVSSLHDQAGTRLHRPEMEPRFLAQVPAWSNTKKTSFYKPAHLG